MGKGLAGITSRILMGIAAGLLVLSYLSVLINPAKAWIMTLSGLLFVPLAILNLVLLVWALKRRSKAFALPLAALFPTVFFIGKYFQVSGPAQSQESGENDQIRIISYNVGRFMSCKDIPSADSCADSIILFLQSCDADVICLQEFYFDEQYKLKSFLERRFRGYYSEYYMNVGENGSYGNVTLSRFPVKGKGKIVFEKSANMAMYTDLDIYGKRVRIYNCHLQSYGISFPGIVKSLRDHDKGYFVRTEARVRTAISRRPKQVDLVLKDIAASPVEAVVCGDFNDNPMSYTYFRMSRGRHDSFVKAGRGFGATYSFLWPMLRIDYVLYPGLFKAVGHQTVKVGYSDHYPVIADFVAAD